MLFSLTSPINQRGFQRNRFFCGNLFNLFPKLLMFLLLLLDMLVLESNSLNDVLIGIDVLRALCV